MVSDNTNNEYQCNNCGWIMDNTGDGYYVCPNPYCPINGYIEDVNLSRDNICQNSVTTIHYNRYYYNGYFYSALEDKFFPTFPNQLD